MIKVSLNDICVPFEVDTGAAVSIMILEQYQNIFNNKTLQKYELT